MKKIGVLLVLALVSFYTTYTIHTDFHLPFHSDEWDHLAYATEVVRTGSIDSIRALNPYTGESYRVNRGPTYHVFLAILKIVTGMDVVSFGLTLPSIVAFILALNTFVFVKYITGSELAGSICGIFATTMKSNVTVLGLWFLAPSSFGIAMAPLFLFLFLRSLGRDRILNPYIWIFSLTLAVVSFSHPPSATVVFPVIVLYLLIHPKIFWRNKLKLGTFAVIALVLLSVELYIIDIPKEDLLRPLYFLKRHMSFTDSDYQIDVKYQYPRFLGDRVIYLAVVGIFYITWSSNRDEERILISALLALLPLIVYYHFTGRIYLTTYRRLFMYNVELLLIMAGIGLYYIYNSLNGLFRRYVKDAVFRLGFHIFLILLILFVTMNQVQSTFEYRGQLYHVVEESDIPAIMWLTNVEGDRPILALPQLSKAIMPLTGKRVVGTTRSTLRSGGKREIDSWSFFSNDCTGKKRLLSRKYGIEYVFSRGRINCPFLKEVHRAKGDYIYKVAL